ncbi:MAG TPA: tetratricopeptide repeat protein [Kofleriaceae bacterium]|nr:tetratricopeptide repeat protein [Kofleriaceae bacterium]
MKHRGLVFLSTRSSGSSFRAGRKLASVLVGASVALAAGSAFAQPAPAPAPKPAQPAPASKPAPKSGPAAKAAPTPTPAPPTAADLAKQGTDAYQAGDFAGAVTFLKQAHELEPSSFAYHFSLAQALRQSGNCTEAIPHYKALIETAPDPATAQDVRSSMEACPEAQPERMAPPPALPPPPPPPLPSSDGISRTNAMMMIGASASLTASVLFFAGSRLDRGDAERGRSVEDYDHISGRANLWLAASIITGGAGVALAVVSIVRHERAKQRGTELSVAPRADGGAALVLGGSF